MKDMGCGAASVCFDVSDTLLRARSEGTQEREREPGELSHVHRLEEWRES